MLAAFFFVLGSPFSFRGFSLGFRRFGSMNRPAHDSVDSLAINTIRFLSVDMVEKANSGHPGAPMGQAALAYLLWTRYLRVHPEQPGWPNRDRFVLSAGHGSMLIYSLLHLAGYDLSLDELKQFRQLGRIDLLVTVHHFQSDVCSAETNQNFPQ